MIRVKYIYGLVPVLLIFFGLSRWKDVESSNATKINGASLVSPPQKISPRLFSSLNDLNANWVAIIPFGFSRGHEPGVRFNHQRQWWGERTDGTCELVKCAKDYDLRILLKPHVWVLGDGWPGEYDLDTESDWQIWEKDYRKYILTYAKIADSLNVDMFAVGTEYRHAVVKRERFWRELIREVREIYDGPLTYAANWDNYQKIQFWDQLDYIGVDAYFPLDDDPNPTIAQLERGWQADFGDLSTFSGKWKRPILFTEYGYQSVDKAAGKHWEIDKSHHALNMEVQANAYQALFNKFWGQEWFAGGFFWKWHLKEAYGGAKNPNFTPQGKLAEEVIRKHFSAYR